LVSFISTLCEQVSEKTVQAGRAGHSPSGVRHGEPGEHASKHRCVEAERELVAVGALQLVRVRVEELSHLGRGVRDRLETSALPALARKSACTSAPPSALASWMKCTESGVRRTVTSAEESFSKAGRKRFSSQPTPTSEKVARNFMAP
jgi:hypothetical protein